ncbi:MAG: Flp pilus assembly complex ATPase component TadA [Phycisphaeraceae bacterium]|nr:Flp pilus assembly complex ATPase component TadA [Phycisphaeraceae bacterium]MCW5755058.1 Flp pilus assembly complex ATPase component TadA [Phycisphaeraceae bacterium]
MQSLRTAAWGGRGRTNFPTMDDRMTMPVGFPDAMLASLMLGQGAWLMSWWKALLFIAPFVLWGKIVSAIFDKHAARFHLNRRRWNAGHIYAGLAALLLGLGVPAMAGIGGIAGFLVGFAIVLVVLGTDIAVYPIIANKDERVPEAHRVNLLDFSQFKERRQAKAEAKKAGRAELVIMQPDKQKLPVPDSDAPEFAVRLAAEKLFLDATAQRASRVDLMQTKEGFAVSHLIDTVRHAAGTLPGAEAMQAIDLWKTAGKLDLAERRKRQMAELKIDREGAVTPVRIVTMGGQAGIRFTMMFDPAAQVRRRADHLGLLDAQLAELRKITEEQQGVVLLTAPPGAGRTTLLYTVIKMHDAYTNNVQTVEIDIQDAIEGVKQNVFDPTKEGAEFDKLVRSILRRDPQVVGVAELDAATAAEIVRADHERTRTYPLLKVDGAMNALKTWMAAVEDSDKAAKCLHGVVAGKLIRKLCDNCRQAYKPAPDMLKKLGLPPDKVGELFRKGGKVLIKNKEEVCPVCHGLGYAGVTGVYEVFAIGEEERQLAASNNLQGLRAELRKKQLPTIQQVALRRAVEGVTSIEEVMRVTAEAPPAKPTPQQEGAKTV